MPHEPEDLTFSSFFPAHLPGLSEPRAKEKILHMMCFSGKTWRSQCNGLSQFLSGFLFAVLLIFFSFNGQ